MATVRSPFEKPAYFEVLGPADERGRYDFGYDPKSGIQAGDKISSVWTAIIYFLEWVKDSGADLDNPVNYD